MSHSPERIVHLEKRSLKRALGAWELFSVGYSDVGSSLYFTLGLIAFFALGATPIALLIASLFFICTCLTYAEMTTTFPEPGGSATFSRYAFNDLISFLAGWGLLLDYIVTIAISAFAIAPYLYFLFPFSYTVFSHIAITIGLILFLFVVNYLGVKHSGRLSLILALISLVSQLAFILFAAALFIATPSLFKQLIAHVSSSNWAPSTSDFIKALAMAMVAYTGIESIAQLAAETKKPSVAIPRAIKGSMYVLVFIYLSFSVIGFSVISPQEMSSHYLNSPIEGILTHMPVGGKWLAAWFGVVASLLLLVAANAGLIGCSRLAFSMGDYYQVPRFFYRLHHTFRTPYVSLAFFTVLAILIVVLSRGSLEFLADLYNFGAQIAFFFAHLSLLVLRWKKPSLHRPYRAPLNIPVGKGRTLSLTAILGLLSTVGVWLIIIVTKPQGRYLGFCWLIVGFSFYFFYRKGKQMPITGQLSIEKVKVPEYRPMHLKHLLVTTRLVGNTEALQTACQLAKSFSAKITAVHVIEMAPALPIDAPMLKREEQAEVALKRAEAVAREYDLTIELTLIRARSFEEAILDLVTHGDYDMVVIGARKEDLKRRDRFTLEAERLLKEAPCRVLFCKS